MPRRCEKAYNAQTYEDEIVRKLDLSEFATNACKFEHIHRAEKLYARDTRLPMKIIWEEQLLRRRIASI